MAPRSYYAVVVKHEPLLLRAPPHDAAVNAVEVEREPLAVPPRSNDVGVGQALIHGALPPSLDCRRDVPRGVGVSHGQELDKAAPSVADDDEDRVSDVDGALAAALRHDA